MIESSGSAVFEQATAASARNGRRHANHAPENAGRHARTGRLQGGAARPRLHSRPARDPARHDRTAREITKGLTQEQLTRRPKEDEWSVAEITAHLFDVDLVFGFRARLILTADNPTYPGYDEKLWTPMPRLPYRELLDAWEGLRRANLLVFDAVPPQAKARTATHQEQGLETYDEVIRKLAGHDLAHLNQMRRAAEAASER